MLYMWSHSPPCTSAPLQSLPISASGPLDNTPLSSQSCSLSCTTGAFAFGIGYDKVTSAWWDNHNRGKQVSSRVHRGFAPALLALLANPFLSACVCSGPSESFSSSSTAYIFCCLATSELKLTFLLLGRAFSQSPLPLHLCQPSPASVSATSTRSKDRVGVTGSCRESCQKVSNIDHFALGFNSRFTGSRRPRTRAENMGYAKVCVLCCLQELCILGQAKEKEERGLRGYMDMRFDSALLPPAFVSLTLRRALPSLHLHYCLDVVPLLLDGSGTSRSCKKVRTSKRG